MRRLAVKSIFLSITLFAYLLYYSPSVVKELWAYSFSRLWFYLFRFRVRVIQHNLVRVFPRQKEESNRQFRVRIQALCKENLKHMAMFFWEFIEVFAWKKSDFENNISVVGAQPLLNSLEKKEGFFLLVAHHGNWELSAKMGAQLNLKVSIVVKYVRNAFLDELLSESRERFKLILMREKGSGRGIVKSIKKGQSVAFMNDQHTGLPNGIPSQFLGIKSWNQKNLPLLAQRLEAPIFPGNLIRVSTKKFRMSFEEPIRIDPVLDLNSEESLNCEIQRVNRPIEKWVEDFPEQYLWMHRRFKDTFSYDSQLPWEL